MPRLIKIKLRGSNKIIEVIPPVARARVNGGTAEYVDRPEGWAQPIPQPETAAMEPSNERAVSREQNPPKRKNR
jgi:hypothetical protein